MKKYIKNQRGIVMPIVLALILIITILGFSIMTVTENQTLMVTRHQQQEKAMHYAEAGVYRYVNCLNDDNTFYKNTGDDLNKNVAIAFEDGYYQLLITAPTTSKPVVTVKSTGWTKSRPEFTRTVEVSVRKRQFVQNIYCSNSEINDKNEKVWWIKGDTVNGPLHTNGNLYINGTDGSGSGPTFNGPVTYSGSLEMSRGTANFFNNIDPQKANALVFPAINKDLIDYAGIDGCSFEGRTCIYINGSSLKILYYDKYSKSFKIKNMSIPANGVIYVGGGTGNKFDPDTANVFVSGKLDGRLTIIALNDIYITAYDPTDWQQPKSSGEPQGTKTDGLKYQGDISNLGTLDDMLGLIAGGYVRILHYNWPSNTKPFYWSTYDVAPNNININAAIFALQKSFEFESYDQDNPKGTITLFGSITQNNRGAVGQFNNGGIVHGYSKSYTHDARMAYDMPPHFLQPMNSGWEIRSWKEQ